MALAVRIHRLPSDDVCVRLYTRLLFPLLQSDLAGHCAIFCDCILARSNPECISEVQGKFKVTARNGMPLPRNLRPMRLSRRSEPVDSDDFELQCSVQTLLGIHSPVKYGRTCKD